jgi:hypothetical protein
MPPAAQDQLAVLKSFPRHPLKVSFQRKAGVRLRQNNNTLIENGHILRAAAPAALSLRRTAEARAL